MNEVVIEDKKYISSKRAAEVTGYAKDYIGQLCREGRVPARLIGRNWYVLESALKDHRFGSEEEAAIPVKAKLEVGEDLKDWVPPRYEAKESIVPATGASPVVSPAIVTQDISEPPLDVSKAWEEWFALPKVPEKTAVTSEVEAEKEIVVPIRALQVSQQRRAEPQEVIWHEEKPEEGASPKSGAIITNTFALVLAVIALALLSINTGYFDTYLSSHQTASIIDGLSAYKK